MRQRQLSRTPERVGNAANVNRSRSMRAIVSVFVAMCVACESAPIGEAPKNDLKPEVEFQRTTNAVASADSTLGQWLLDNTERFYGTSLPDSVFGVLSAGIGSRRVVMLGETEGTVSEHTSLKVSIVRALHEQRGFNVLAFEGPLWNCTPVLNPSLSYRWRQLLESCATENWDADELGELFRYVESTQRTKYPLVVVGLDGTSLPTRDPARSVFASLVKPVDSTYAASVHNLDSLLVSLSLQHAPAPIGQRRPVPFQVAAGFDTLSKWFAQNARNELASEAVAARYSLAAAQARSNGKLARELGSFRPAVNRIASGLMAENLAFIADTLYPSQRIVVWSRNARIMRQPPPLRYGDSARSNLAVQFERASPKNTPYAIALLKGEGDPTASDQDYSQYRRTNSLERLLFDPKGRTVLLTTTPQGTLGTKWLSKPVIAGRADTGRVSFAAMDNYDAVLVVSTVPAALQTTRPVVPVRRRNQR